MYDNTITLLAESIDTSFVILECLLDFNLEFILESIITFAGILNSIPGPDMVLPTIIITISGFICIFLATHSEGTFIPSVLDLHLANILLTKAEDFIKGLKDLPDQEAIDKIRAELDETMSRPITPKSEKYMDDLNDELEKRTS